MQGAPAGDGCPGISAMTGRPVEMGVAGEHGGGSRLSQDLRALLERGRGEALTLNEIEEALRGRGLAMLIFILALPFCLPVPLVGFTIPFGLAIAFLGVRLGFGLRPWLPGGLLEKKIPGHVLERTLRGGEGVARWLERVVRSRWDFTRWPGMRCAIGVAIALCGLGLMLPVPFTNMIVGVAIILLALGIMEGDGLFVVLGFIAAAGFCGIVGAMFFLGRLGWETLWPAGAPG